MFHSAIAKLTPHPHVVWYNAKQDRKASIYGACPWFDGTSEDDWEKVESGWTFKVDHKDGSVTYGLGRPVMETREEADAYVEAFNARKAS